MVRATTLVRYLVVTLGAVIITAALLLFMQKAAIKLSRPETLKYFAIADFIPAPDRGRQKPKEIPKPELTPERGGLTYETTDQGNVADLENPAADVDVGVAPAPVIVEPSELVEPDKK
jgi:hypothetical protein